LAAAEFRCSGDPKGHVATMTEMKPHAGQWIPPAIRRPAQREIRRRFIAITVRYHADYVAKFSATN
jgi:hypothetical protein